MLLEESTYTDNTESLEIPETFNQLRERIEQGEKCISPSVAACLSALAKLDVEYSTNTLHELVHIRKTVNDYVYSLARTYNPSLAKIYLGNPNDGYIYPAFKLFPLTTLEWIMAISEIFITYGRFCKPSMRKVRKKVTKTLTMRYPTHARRMLEELEEIRVSRDKSGWQDALYNMVSDVVDRISFNLKYEEHFAKYVDEDIVRFRDAIADIFPFSWSHKQIRELKYEIRRVCSSPYPDETKKSILFFKVISLMAL